MSYLESQKGGNGDAELVTTRPVPRTMRRSALRPASSRATLAADARAEARLVRGRNRFIWNGRVLPIGVPLGAATGLVVWNRRRSMRQAIAFAALATATTYFAARIEWEMYRASYARRRDEDFVSDD
jgi:hypothetical protein